MRRGGPFFLLFVVVYPIIDRQRASMAHLKPFQVSDSHNYNQEAAIRSLLSDLREWSGGVVYYPNPLLERALGLVARRF